MAKWSTYGVFATVNGRPMWDLTTNKKHALATAKKHGGYVKRVPYDYGVASWDAPTFRLVSDFVADYRPENQDGNQ